MNMSFRDEAFREAFRLVEKLEEAGHQAVIVGGSVRDALLGRHVHDIDIATSATPEDVQCLFSHTVPTGLRHGTVTVIVEKQSYEVTTFRTEGPYVDARRPSYVHFVRDLKTDLARRDFTINAIALNRDRQIVDPFGGRTDLKRRLVRCVGQANDRFREDPLRILRAVRFVAQLGFEIETSTLSGMKAEKAGLRKLAVERITSELDKLMTVPQPSRALRLLWEEQLLQEIVPLSPYPSSTVPARNDFQLVEQEKDAGLRWILFLRLCGVQADRAKQAFRRFKKSRRDVQQLSLIWREAEHWPGASLSVEEMRWKVFSFGLRHVLRIIRLASYMDRLTETERHLLRRQLCHADWELPLDDVSQLALDGHTLMRMTGRVPGPWIGNVRHHLLQKVVAGKIVNHPQQLIKEWQKYGPHAP